MAMAKGWQCPLNESIVNVWIKFPTTSSLENEQNVKRQQKFAGTFCQSQAKLFLTVRFVTLCVCIHFCVRTEEEAHRISRLHFNENQNTNKCQNRLHHIFLTLMHHTSTVRNVFFFSSLTACDVREEEEKKIMQIVYTVESVLLFSIGVNAAFVYINDWSGAYSIDCHWNLSQCFRSICVCVQPATGVCVCVWNAIIKIMSKNIINFARQKKTKPRRRIRNSISKWFSMQISFDSLVMRVNDLATDQLHLFALNIQCNRNHLNTWFYDGFFFPCSL